jgi:hypothetical protein
MRAASIWNAMSDLLKYIVDQDATYLPWHDLISGDSKEVDTFQWLRMLSFSPRAILVRSGSVGLRDRTYDGCHSSVIIVGDAAANLSTLSNQESGCPK